MSKTMNLNDFFNSFDESVLKHLEKGFEEFKKKVTIEGLINSESVEIIDIEYNLIEKFNLKYLDKSFNDMNLVAKPIVAMYSKNIKASANEFDLFGEKRFCYMSDQVEEWTNNMTLLYDLLIRFQFYSDNNVNKTFKRLKPYIFTELRLNDEFIDVFKVSSRFHNDASNLTFAHYHLLKHGAVLCSDFENLVKGADEKKLANTYLNYRNNLEFFSILIDSFNFDYLNLISNDYFNDDLKDIITSISENNSKKISRLIDSIYDPAYPIEFFKKLKGLSALVFASDEEFNLIKDEKKQYCRTNKDSLISVCDNIVSSRLFELISDKYKDDDVSYGLLEKEFMDSSDKKWEYIQKIQLSENVERCLSEIKNVISDLPDSSEKYLSLIKNDMSYMDYYLDKKIIGIIKNSIKGNWFDLLEQNLGILKNAAFVDDLIKDKKGDLYYLFTDNWFNKQFFKRRIIGDYSRLRNLYVVDEDLFRSVCEVGDLSEFDSSLDNLVELRTLKKPEFIVNYETLTYLKNIDMASKKKVHHFFENLDLIKEAESFNLLPFCLKADDKSDLIDWFNLQDRSEFERIVYEWKLASPFIEVEDYSLIQKVAYLIENFEITDKLRAYKSLDLINHYRMIDLLHKVENPKKLLRKRELESLVLNKVKNANEQDFEIFMDKLSKMNSDKYDSLLEIYPDFCKETKKKKKTEIDMLNERLISDNKLDLLEDLIQFKRDKILSVDQYDRVLNSLKERNYLISEFVVNRINEGHSISNLMEIFNLCDGSDHEFRQIDVDDFLEKKSDADFSKIYKSYRSQPFFKIASAKIKTAFKQYDGRIKSLKKIGLEYGFTIKHAEGGHYSIIFKENDKYTVTMSATPSCSNSPMNIASEVINTLLIIYHEKECVKEKERNKNFPQ